MMWHDFLKLKSRENELPLARLSWNSPFLYVLLSSSLYFFLHVTLLVLFEVTSLGDLLLGAFFSFQHSREKLFHQQPSRSLRLFAITQKCVFMIGPSGALYNTYRINRSLKIRSSGIHPFKCRMIIRFKIHIFILLEMGNSMFSSSSTYNYCQNF